MTEKDEKMILKNLNVNGESYRRFSSTSILAKWRQKPRRKGIENLQLPTPQEIYSSRHFANMQTVTSNRRTRHTNRQNIKKCHYQKNKKQEGWIYLVD
ncbi:MAG: hypothetical protein Q4C12_08845, partial [Clostridia bacterium]|nr:hypothetical protein [Clostridia bacterium]